MSKLFLVFGTQGAGKSTVLSGVKSAKIVNVGDEMFAAYSKKFKIKNRDQIRGKSLSNYSYMMQTRNGILRKAAKRAGSVVVDTHATVKIGDAYEVGLSFKDLDSLKKSAKAIIYIDATNAEILARREKDKTKRSREQDTDASLETHRKLNMSFTAIYAMYLGIPIYVVMNGDWQLEAAQKRIDAIIKSAK